ncbi:MAG: alanine--tRNA ligase [Firmicutes bacterium]|nr:alanine--tRNA ligase [Bacillota bacterium]
MKKLNYKQLRDMWLDFYRERGHAIIPSASVVPENDASVLFINSGMHPLVPYLMGEAHPAGVRLANVQKCIRTGDIEEVGDATHLTFFEMMGNWSLGDYFKREKTAWSYEFLTDKKYLGIDPERIYVTCFEGDDIAPRDIECERFWLDMGIPSERIFFLPKSENWWQLPSGTGPCGPDSEMFMELKPGACGPDCNPSCSCGRFVEIGNDVYMQYVIHNAGERAVPAKQQNVDTGMGLERLLCLSQGKKSVYDTELFVPAIKLIKDTATNEIDMNAVRVVAEHVRAAMIIISDGVTPCNTGGGYVLRRLMRRAVRMAHKLGCPNDIYAGLIDSFMGTLGESYPELRTNREMIVRVFMEEVGKFDKTLQQGLREFDKVVTHIKTTEMPGKTAFRLYETYGFPIELTTELATERGLTINMDEYAAAREKHAAASKTANVGAFKGGLADTSGETVKLHTAAHLLLESLRRVYGNHVNQKGSNITPERLRFDFNLDHKMMPDELRVIEDMVNDAISQKLPISFELMKYEEAKQSGAIGVFGDKYGEMVKVYRMGDYSHELCGGPHVDNTTELGTFKIIKEESVAAGIRRIKAILQ